MSSQYLNNYRGMAILLVIFSHSVSTLAGVGGGGVGFVSPIFGSGTLFFMLVAGRFFASFSDEYNYQKFLVNKVKFVVAPYLITSLPAALIYVSGLKSKHEWIDMAWFHELNPVVAYLYLIATGGHLGPLWFIPMMLFCYLISPLFIFLIKKNWLGYAMVLTLVPATYFGRPHGNSNFAQSLLYFMPPYILGMAMNKNNEMLKALRQHAGLILFVSLVVLIVFGKSDFAGLHWHLPLGLISALMLLNFLEEKANYKIKFLELMARLSFFLFFVHGYFIGFYREMFKGFAPFQYSGVVVCSVFVSTVFLCVALYIPLKYKLKDKSRYYIGA